MNLDGMVTFTLGGMVFEYDEEKNRKNFQRHGISFRSAARIFFDYDRIELYDEGHSVDEERYDTIGDTSAGNILLGSNKTIVNINQIMRKANDILFVVYTERVRVDENGIQTGVIRLISARLATNFERGYIMVNMNNMTEELKKELVFTNEEMEELEKAREIPITFDEDCPEITPEKAIKFQRVNPPQRLTGNNLA